MLAPEESSPAVAAPASRPLASVSRPLASARTARPGIARPSNIPTSYGYVLSDLKRIGITSGVLFAIIVGLSVVMR